MKKWFKQHKQKFVIAVVAILLIALVFGPIFMMLQ